MTKSVSQKLAAMRAAILGTLTNPEILEAVSNYGYTQEVMEDGQKELERVQQLVLDQINEYGSQYEATQGQTNLFESAYAAYMVALKVARIALKGNVGILSSIKATGGRNRTLSRWLVDSRAFCSNLLGKETALQAMTKFGHDEAKIKALLDQIDQVEKAHQIQLDGKGGAQQSTLDRDLALDKLFNWYSDFRGIARIAMYDKPQLLEKLGIVVKRQLGDPKPGSS